MKHTPLYQVGRAIVPPIFQIGNPLIINGAEKMPPKGRVVICCNHLTMKDPIFVSTVHKRQINYMAKAELFENKMLAGLFRSLGAFPVHRGQGDADAMASARKLLTKPTRLFFPCALQHRTARFLLRSRNWLFPAAI